MLEIEEQPSWLLIFGTPGRRGHSTLAALGGKCRRSAKLPCNFGGAYRGITPPEVQMLAPPQPEAGQSSQPTIIARRHIEILFVGVRKCTREISYDS